MSERTHLIQVTVATVNEGPRIFSDKMNEGTPLVVVVEPMTTCCYPKLDIPSGVITLGQKWGAHDGILDPGMKCCWCKHRRVGAMITRNTIRYDAPIKNCPTKDNVRISVDISLSFHIGPGEDDCRNFFYRMGPCRLDELLAAESEEALRNFVHSVRLSQIQDIKGEIATTLLGDLNRKFNRFGVFFENVQIMTIRIPDVLQSALQDTTKYDIML